MAGYDLKTALQKLGKKRMNFGLYRGADADQVLITSKAASAKQIEEMEKECGGVKRLLKGVVFLEGGATVFATKATAQPMYEKIIASIFKERKCGSYLPVTLRQLSAQDSDEVAEDAGGVGVAPSGPGASTAPTQGAPASGSAKEDWERLKAELIPRVKSALADAALKEPLTKLVTEALGLEKAGAYPAAIAVFEKARALIGGGNAPVTGAPENAARAEWDKLKAELVPQIRAALANPELKDALNKLVAEALGKEKAGAFPEAVAVFRKAQELLGGGASAGGAVRPPPVAPPPPPPKRKGHSPKALQAALNKLTPQIKRALAANPGAKEQILRPVADMQKQFKAGDTAAAQASLVKLSAALKTFGAYPGATAA